MSGQATGWVLRFGPKDRAQRLVLLTIADAANRDGEYAHPGMDAIVEGSLYSAGHARRAIARLVEDGWLEVTDHAAPGRATTYRIPGVAAHNARRSEGDVARSAEPSSRDSGPIVARPDARPNGVTNGTTNGLPTTPSRADRRRAAEPDGFAEWYAIYPRRVGRPEAAEAYRRARSRADADALLAGARVVAAAVAAGQELKYTLYPATWLNRDGWLDDPSHAFPASRPVRPGGPPPLPGGPSAQLPRGTPGVSGRLEL